MTNPRWLKTAARRSGERTWTLGHVFERYRAMEERSAEALAQELGCSLEVLQWLSLCRRPEGELFAEHLNVIAKRFEVEPQRLAAVLRHVEVMDALASRRDSGGAEHRGSLLLAARDRTSDDETNS